MQIRDVMVPTVDSIDAADTIAYAAARMAEDDLGIFPVLRTGKLVGIVTDRDIAVRAVATGIAVDAPVECAMTRSVSTCAPQDELEHVIARMAREKVRRMPVCDGAGEVIGMVSLADAAKSPSLNALVARTLAAISAPSGLHCQAPVFA